MNKKLAFVDLFLISALGLFLELVFIRWAASELRILAFYKNFALIGAFLGLGLGYAVRRRWPNLNLFERYFFSMLAICVLLVLLMGRTVISELILLNRTNADEFLWAGALTEDTPVLNLVLDISFYIVLLLLFVLITLLFIPLGELTARKFTPYQPLQGYTLNTLGSATGVGLYTLVSFLGWPPESWFLVTALGGIYFLLQTKNSKVIFQVSLALAPVILTLFWPTGAERTLWSPYYRIDLTPIYTRENSDVKLGYELSVNKAWHQKLWNLGTNFVQENYALNPLHFDTQLAKYDSPLWVAPRLDEVLVVGAGAGNDVAGALRAGAKHVTAVEIDPRIFDIGKELHPENPYADESKVTLIVQDARSFFRRDHHTYDLIIFGTLDSHTLFSTASSVRLDNFVYTRESIEEVRNLLKEDGILALSFGVPATNEWVGLRLFNTLTDSFGHSPLVYEFPNEDILFLIGRAPGVVPIIEDDRLTPRPDYDYQTNIQVASDDWPYLYLKTRAISSTYLIGLGGMLFISFFLTRKVYPTFRELDMHFFFMGTAFFLLETKSITEMALLFGSTWIVNAVVILAILMMIVLANILVHRFELNNANGFYILLGIALVFNYLVPVSSFLGLPLTIRIILATITQVIPLFFAGMIFAITFRKTNSIEIALASNLIGSVFGGVCEYFSLVLGIRGLYLLALGFYILSVLGLQQAFPRLVKTYKV